MASGLHPVSFTCVIAIGRPTSELHRYRRLTTNQKLGSGSMLQSIQAASLKPSEIHKLIASAIKPNMLSMLDRLRWNSRLIRLAATQEACSAMVLYGISFVGLIGRCPHFPAYRVNIMGLQATLWILYIIMILQQLHNQSTLIHEFTSKWLVHSRNLQWPSINKTIDDLLRSAFWASSMDQGASSIIPIPWTALATN